MRTTPRAAGRVTRPHGPARILLATSMTALLALAACTSAVEGSGVRADATSASSTGSGQGGGSGSTASGAGERTVDPGDATAADLPAVLRMSPQEQEQWLRRASMAFELRRGEESGLVAAVGGRETYAQILLDQAAWFDKQLGAPGLRRAVSALRDGDSGSINDPKTQVGLGEAYGAPLGGGQDFGGDEWAGGQRGEIADPSNPKNTASIDDNNVSSTVHLQPYENDQVKTEITMKKDSEMCPNPKGKMRVVYTFEIDSVSKTGGGNYHGSWIVGVTAQLDDDAQIVSTDTEFQYQNGGSAGAGEELSGSLPGDGSAQATKDGQGWAYVAAMSKDFQGKNVTEALKKTIERGKCVKLGLKPSDGPDGLATDTEVTIDSTPVSALDGAQAKGTVQAKLSSGTKSVSPEGKKQPANPTATFTYTSAEKVDEKGTVDFVARSLRGVGKEQMTLTTGECVVGTWAMSNESWTSVVGPVAAQNGADMKATGGPILTTYRKDGTFEFTFNGFTIETTVSQGNMTVVYGGKDTGTWKRTGAGQYVIAGLKAGVQAKATVDVSGMHMNVPMDYHAALQPNTAFTCSGDVISVQTPYGEVTLDRQK
ncbi:MAG: hypothetical protein J0I11_01690 [Actinobacteria bacterium]|nr:hypothetical protein [Actinomycetota bacterium]